MKSRKPTFMELVDLLPAETEKLVTEMSNTLSRAEMLQMRQGVMSFCSKDNLDCPEIMRLMGRAE